MDSTRFDHLTKDMANQTNRRRIVTGMGGLALASVGLLGLARSAGAQVETADNRRKCFNRCKDHCGDNVRNRKCKDRCRRKCGDR